MLLSLWRWRERVWGRGRTLANPACAARHCVTHTKQTRNRASHSLTKLPGWLFTQNSLSKPINVYRTWGVSPSSCCLRSSTCSAPECSRDVNGLGLGSTWSQMLPGLPRCCVDQWEETQSSTAPGMLRCLLWSFTQRGDSHVEKRGPCDGPDSEPGGALTVHTSALDASCTHESTTSQQP